MERGGEWKGKRCEGGGIKRVGTVKVVKVRTVKGVRVEEFVESGVEGIRGDKNRIVFKVKSVKGREEGVNEDRGGLIIR